MKDKIIIFIIGLLLGSIISTGSIYFYTVANKSDNNTQEMRMPNMQNGERPEMPSGENGERPEMPNNNQNKTQNNN